jgi:hypothetical protein
MIYQPSVEACGAALHDAHRESESIEVLALSGSLLRLVRCPRKLFGA